MHWSRKHYHLPQYEWASSNQHGARFKRIARKQLYVARLSSKFPNDVNDLRHLILLADQLNVPVRYDFDSDPQEAFIEVVSFEALKEEI